MHDVDLLGHAGNRTRVLLIYAVRLVQGCTNTSILAHYTPAIMTRHEIAGTRSYHAALRQDCVS